MKIIEMKEEIKKKDDEKVVLIRMGNFFAAFGEDSFVLEKELGLKRNCFGKTCCKVGIPYFSIKKYVEILKSKEISFVVYDYSNISKFEYEVNGKYYNKIYDFYFDKIVDFDYSWDCNNCDLKIKKLESNSSVNSDSNSEVDELKKIILEVVVNNNFILNKINDISNSVNNINSRLVSMIGDFNIEK